MLDELVPQIDAPRVHALLAEAQGRFDVEARRECGSTNSELLTLAENGAASGTVLVADHQTAGRGRRGRQWIASPDASLTFSVLWRFAGGLERLAGLSLAVGVALVQALEALGAKGVALKWPNDLLYKNGKLGGILIELQGDPNHALAVIGIGLNLQAPADQTLSNEFALAAASLDQILDPLPERPVLFAELLRQLAGVFDQFSNGGFAALRERWQAMNVWQNCPVRLIGDGCVVKEGICLGADDDGSLLLGTKNGVERCLSGDLSLRAR